jgi:hypothetical protein
LSPALSGFLNFGSDFGILTSESSSSFYHFLALHALIATFALASYVLENKNAIRQRIDRLLG